MTDDEIDLDSGFLMVLSAVPAPSTPATEPGTGGAPVLPGQTPTTTPTPTRVTPQPGAGATAPKVRTSIRISFPASRDDVFKSFQAIANLADKSDGNKIKITVEGQCAAGYDPNWLRNAVQEPLDEADIDGMEVI
jgi:hypothetical protein